MILCLIGLEELVLFGSTYLFQKISLPWEQFPYLPVVWILTSLVALVWLCISRYTYRLKEACPEVPALKPLFVFSVFGCLYYFFCSVAVFSAECMPDGYFAYIHFLSQWDTPLRELGQNAFFFWHSMGYFMINLRVVVRWMWVIFAVWSFSAVFKRQTGTGNPSGRTKQWMDILVGLALILGLCPMASPYHNVFLYSFWENAEAMQSGEALPFSVLWTLSLCIPLLSCTGWILLSRAAGIKKRKEAGALTARKALSIFSIAGMVYHGYHFLILLQILFAGTGNVFHVIYTYAFRHQWYMQFRNEYLIIETAGVMMALLSIAAALMVLLTALWKAGKPAIQKYVKYTEKIKMIAVLGTLLILIAANWPVSSGLPLWLSQAAKSNKMTEVSSHSNVFSQICRLTAPGKSVQAPEIYGNMDACFWRMLIAMCGNAVFLFACILLCRYLFRYWKNRKTASQGKTFHGKDRKNRASVIIGISLFVLFSIYWVIMPICHILPDPYLGRESMPVSGRSLMFLLFATAAWSCLYIGCIRMKQRSIRSMGLSVVRQCAWIGVVIHIWLLFAFCHMKLYGAESIYLRMYDLAGSGTDAELWISVIRMFVEMIRVIVLVAGLTAGAAGIYHMHCINAKTRDKLHIK